MHRYLKRFTFAIVLVFLTFYGTSSAVHAQREDTEKSLYYTST